MRRSSEEVDPASRTSSTAAQRSASRGDRVARQHQDGLAPLVVILAVLVGSSVAYLRTHDFYFWDDSAAAFLPTWYAVGQELWSGTWPTMRPDFWMGGNWAAEAQFGLWNPVNLVMMMAVAKLPDLAVSAFIVKAFWQVMLAMGGYLLAREYGANPWPAAAVAVALPFAGFTLYFDASMWIAGLIATVWTAWFWWAARRVLNGRLNPFIGFIFGYLLITNGNPYGALSAVIVLMGLALEALLHRQFRALWKLVLMGGLVGCTALVAYLPLLLTAEVGWRTAKGIVNDGDLAINSLMLMGTSTSTMLPDLFVWRVYGSSVPVAYSAWFLLPILPWLNWSASRTKARQMAGLWWVLGVYLVLALGPSQIWMFRWPVRLLEYVWLASFVIVAVVWSQGVRTDAWKLRAAGSVVIAFAGALIAFLMAHDVAERHLVGLIVQVALIGVMIVFALKAERLLPGLFIAGTLATLVLQIIWMPYSTDGTLWQFRLPSSAAAAADYRGRVQGPLLQVAQIDVTATQVREEAGGWLLFGSMPGAFGVESTTSYTGLGFDVFAGALCISYAGATCPEAFNVAFGALPDAGGARFVDATKMNTVLVENRLVPGVAQFEPPPGWRLAETNEWVAVFVRDSPLPWPDSRLSVADGVSVAAASSSDTSEILRVSTGSSGGSLTFARLAWPGYTATVNGEETPIITNSAGLLRVDLPAELSDAVVSIEFTAPGYGVAVPVLLMAILAAAAQGLVVARGAKPRRAAADD